MITEFGSTHEMQKAVYEHYRREGIIAGLRELERVAAWLTQTPDTKRQAEHRKRVAALIHEYKNKHGL